MKDRYQIEESSSTFSFKPFHHRRSKLKWYVLAILISGGLSTYYYEPMNELLLIVSATILILTVWSFLKEILLYIPIRYTFERSTNEVCRSTLFVSKRKIMKLDEIVVYQNSEMGGWQYKMGKKKSQFVKSYAISEYFSNKKNNEKTIAFECAILNRIEQMTTTLSSTIPANSGSSSFHH
ncbi:hypothetical protein [Sphingobacterium sp. LRF_L2]|uniref:hypothetical protein n=1 Tax=Sphingobacterium sp. LRF_L2 TaxID=3369421 RepID=UPI003F5E23D2